MTPQVTNNGRATVRSTICRWKLLLEILERLTPVCDGVNIITSVEDCMLADLRRDILDGLEGAR